MERRSIIRITVSKSAIAGTSTTVLVYYDVCKLEKRKKDGVALDLPLNPTVFGHELYKKESDFVCRSKIRRLLFLPSPC
jgi:hypothetical protein